MCPSLENITKLIGEKTLMATEKQSTIPAESEANFGPPLPKWVFKYVINPLMKTLLRSPLHGLVSGRLLLLTFTGRKTGKQYTTPVGYDQENHTLRLFTESPWWKNLQGHVPVTVRLRGTVRTGQAYAITETDEVAEVLLDIAQKREPQYARMLLGIELDPAQPVTREDVRPAAARRVVICIELE